MYDVDVFDDDASRTKQYSTILCGVYCTCGLARLPPTVKKRDSRDVKRFPRDSEKRRHWLWGTEAKTASRGQNVTVYTSVSKETVSNEALPIKSR